MCFLCTQAEESAKKAAQKAKADTQQEARDALIMGLGVGMVTDESLAVEVMKLSMSILHRHGWEFGLTIGDTPEGSQAALMIGKPESDRMILLCELPEHQLRTLLYALDAVKDNAARDHDDC